MSQKLFILLFVCCTSGAVQSQQNKFTIGLGYQRTWLLDKQASPLKYQTSEKTFSFGYAHTGTKGKFGAELNGSFGNLFPTGFKNRQWYDPSYNNDGTPKRDSGLLIGTLYNAHIKVDYLREVSSGFTKIGNGKLEGKNYAGASLDNQLFYTDNIVRAGWLNSSSINAVYEHTTLLSAKHFFNIKISIPLFARNTRLPYHNSVSSASAESNVKTLFKQGSRYAWLGNFQNIRFDAGYEYSLDKKWVMGLHYSGQWLRYTRGQPINLYQNNIGITASIK